MIPTNIVFFREIELIDNSLVNYPAILN